MPPAKVEMTFLTTLSAILLLLSSFGLVVLRLKTVPVSQKLRLQRTWMDKNKIVSARYVCITLPPNQPAPPTRPNGRKYGPRWTVSRHSKRCIPQLFYDFLKTKLKYVCSPVASILQACSHFTPLHCYPPEAMARIDGLYRWFPSPLVIFFTQGSEKSFQQNRGRLIHRHV